MTHHTRQSAVGLPQIKEKTYGGKAYAVTEYTMSEIIGAVYDAMAATGKDQGILFLDEINCVSETPAPMPCLRAGSSWRRGIPRNTTNPFGILIL